MNINKDRLAILDAADEGKVSLNPNSGAIIQRTSTVGGSQYRRDSKVRELVEQGLLEVDDTGVYKLTDKGRNARDAARAEYEARRIQPKNGATA